MPEAMTMFTDRYRGAKIGIALSLLVMGFSGSNLRGRAASPSIGDCQMHPEQHHGQQVWVPGAWVLRVAPDHFVIDTRTTQILVEGTLPDLKAGQFIRLVATFDRRNLLRLDADSRWDRPPGVRSAWIEALASVARAVGLGGYTSPPVFMYAISTLVMLWIGWRFFREFRGRLAVPAFVSRTTLQDSKIQDSRFKASDDGLKDANRGPRTEDRGQGT